jgi:DNA polymerase III beta subunit
MSTATETFKAAALQENLARAADAVRPLFRTPSVIDAARALRIDASDGRLWLSATDTTVLLTVECGAMLEDEGRVSVPGLAFCDLIARLPDDKVSMTLQKGKLAISCASVKATLPTLDAADFPVLIQPQGETHTLTMDVGAYTKAVARTVSFADPKSLRGFLQGVTIRPEQDKTLSLVSGDGYRVSLASVPAQDVVGLDNGIPLTPRSLGYVASALKLAPEGVLSLTYAEGWNAVRFQAGPCDIYAVRLQDVPPFHEIVLKQDRPASVSVSASALLRAVQAATAVMEGRRTQAIRIEADPAQDALHLSVAESEAGAYAQDIPARAEGKPFRVALNHAYLTDMLALCDRGADIVLRGNTEREPVLLSPVEGDAWIYIVAPEFVNW